MVIQRERSFTKARRSHEEHEESFVQHRFVAFVFFVASRSDVA